jgi:hypothetical protein
MGTDLQIDPALRAFVPTSCWPGWTWSPTGSGRRWRSCRSGSAAGSSGHWPSATSSPRRSTPGTASTGRGDPAEYESYLTSIGYLARRPTPRLTVTHVDDEIARVPGPSWSCRPPSRATR